MLFNKNKKKEKLYYNSSGWLNNRNNSNFKLLKTSRICIYWIHENLYNNICSPLILDWLKHFW